MATSAQNLAIAKLYTALFNRAPDADGFAFWAQALANGASLDALAQSMLGAPEAVAIYPAGQTSAQFVTAYYSSVFGRAPDAEGLAFWSAALDAQGGAGNAAARAGLTMQISSIASTPLTSKPDGMSDAAYAQTVADRARFINKTEFGVYFATDLKSNDLTLAKSTLALVTDNANSLTAATNLATGTPTQPAPSAPAPEPVLAITAADSAIDIASKFTAYNYSSAKVDATDMDTAQLSAVAAAVSKIGVAGITGAFALSNTQTVEELRALLGPKTAVAATVSVVATSMVAAKVAELGLGAARIDVLTGLPQVNLSDTWTVPEVVAGLLSAAAPAGISFINGIYAKGAQLNLIADHLDKVSVLTGGVRLNSDVTSASMETFLAARAANSTVVPRITVSADGMSAAQVGVVLGKLTSVRSLEIGSGASPALIATLLAAPGMDAVTVSVSAYGMTDAAQIAAIGLGGANVDSIGNVEQLVLTLDAPAMTDAASVALLSLVYRLGTAPNTLRVVITGASDTELGALASYLHLLAINGITGSLSLGRSTSAELLGALLSNKMADAADVQLDVNGMSVDQLNAVAAGVAKVDAIAPVNVIGMSSAQLTALAGTAAKLGVVNGLNLAFPQALGSTVLGTLLAKAPDASVAVVATGANATELTVLAANLGKIDAAGVTGTVLLTKDLSESVLTSLLGAPVTASATIDVDAADMSVAQLQALSGNAGRIHSVVNQPAIVLADLTASDATLTQLLSVAVDGSLSVQAQGATASQLAILANAQAKLATDGITGTFTLGASLSAEQIAALLGSKTALAATANVDATGMSSAQLAAVNQGLTKLDAFSNMPTLKLGDVAMTQAVISWLASIAPYQTLRVDATDGSMDKILAVLGSGLDKIASDGITGTVNLTAALPSDMFNTFFNYKVAEAANVQVDATGMTNLQLADIGFMRARIDGVVGVTIRLAEFVADINMTRYVEQILTVSNPGSVKVDLNGVNWNYVSSLVLPGLAKVMDGGISGSFTISSTATTEQINSLLSTKTAADAVVTVQAGAASDQKLVDLAGLLPKITTISDLELQLSTNTVDREVLSTVMSKAAAAQVGLDGATDSDVALMLNNLSHIGSFSGTLKMSVAQFGAVNAPLLDSKLPGAYGGLVIVGDASDDAIDLSSMTKSVRVEAGAGADTITAGGGSDIVYLASKADTRIDSFSANTSTAHGNIDVITLGAGDVLKLSTVAGDFVAGISLGRNGMYANRSIAAADTFQELFAAIDGSVFQGSKIGASEYLRLSVSGGSLAGNYLIVNDANKTLDINDTIIGLTLNGYDAQSIDWLGF